MKWVGGGKKSQSTTLYTVVSKVNDTGAPPCGPLYLLFQRITWSAVTLKFFEPESSRLFLLTEQPLFRVRTTKRGQDRSDYRWGDTGSKLCKGSIHFVISKSFPSCFFQSFPQHVDNSNKWLYISSLCKLNYLSTACRMCAIQLFRSSLEVVWISYISGSLEEAQIRNMAFSSWATSLTISFWREITDGLLSWVDDKKNEGKKKEKDHFMITGS